MISRLIKFDLGIQSDSEPECHEFGCYIFDTLPNIRTFPKEEVIVNMVDNAISTQSTNLDIGISKVEIQGHQEKHDFYRHILNMLNMNNL